MPTPTPAKPESPSQTASSPQGSTGRRIAIVSRLDDAAGAAARAFIEQLGLEPVLVPGALAHDLAGSIDMLEEVRGADYVIVLRPADDLGSTPGGPGLRSDVLLELGFLFGAVGRRRVCFILAGKPSPGAELDAVTARHAMDDAGLWRLLLAREMRQAGLDVDMNRAL